MDTAEVDRAAGTLLGLAVGNALGAGYEGGEPPADRAAMIGGGPGGWAPGEWTGDTQMALCIAEVTATGGFDLDAIGRRLLDRDAEDRSDVGAQSAPGNGSLARTAPVALAHVGDDTAIAESAQALSALTHADPLAGQACVLWCVAIDRAVRERRLDGIRDGLDLLDAPARRHWAPLLDAAETAPPGSFAPNGSVVTALQAAHAAVTQTPVPAAEPWRHLQDALHAAVRIGDDTDTVAAVAGALLGARWGASAVPFAWTRRLHGRPGLAARDCVRLAVLTARRGGVDAVGWPAADAVAEHYGGVPEAAPLPDDPCVVIGNLAGAVHTDADAVVSLCRVGATEMPAGVTQHEAFLVDDPDANPNLPFVVADAADAVATLRDEGCTVFLHCAAGRSRMPTVAAAYLASRLGVSGTEALERVRAVVPEAVPNHRFLELLEGLGR